MGVAFCPRIIFRAQFMLALLKGRSTNLYRVAEELPLNKNYRPDKSLFSLGLDLLRRILKNSCVREELPNFIRVLAVLSRLMAY